MFQWFVINTYSGHENKVKTNLEHRIVSMNQQPAFRRVVVPTEQVIETKDGQKVQTEKRVLPGYVLVNMNMSDEAWTVVKGTPGVTGFVGAGTKPVPLSQPEVDRILHHGAPAGGGPTAKSQVEFSLGEPNLAGAENVDTVIVDGRFRKRGGRLLDVDTERVVRSTEQTIAALLAR